MSIESSLIEFITAEMPAGAGGGPLTPESPLISSGSLDSLGLLRVLGHIQQQYGVDLFASGSPKDFDSVAGMAAAIRRLGGHA